jgi:hypothetical protein
VQRVGREGFSVCLPRNHLLTQKVGVTAHDLDREMVFWMPRSLQPRYYGRVMKYISNLGVQALFREVKSEAHALEFAARGFGIALLPRSAAHITHSGTVFKPLTDRYLGIETVLLFSAPLQSAPLRNFSISWPRMINFAITWPRMTKYTDRNL